jgi:signal transduction histidine kinase
MESVEPAAATPPTSTAWSPAIVGGVMGGLLAIDVLLGQAYLGVNRAAVVVGVAVGVAVVAATRWLLAATLAAAAASLSMSVLLVLADPGPRLPSHGFAEDALRLSRTVWPGMAELVGLGLLTAWSIRMLRPSDAWVATIATGSAVLAVAQARTYGTYYRPMVTVIVLLGFATAVGAGVFLRVLDTSHRRAAEHVRQDERMSIARELHDVVAHAMTGIVVQAQAAQLVATERPQQAADALAAIESAGAEALTAMRRMVGTLRTEGPAELSPAATLADLHRLADRSAALGLPVRLTLACRPEDLPPALVISVHRMVQEAITNAYRHARDATAVDVCITTAAPDLMVVVRDDGRPTRSARPATPGYGLLGMAERAAALGGTFSAGPGPDGGWQVEARLPLAGVER